VEINPPPGKQNDSLETLVKKLGSSLDQPWTRHVTYSYKAAKSHFKLALHSCFQRVWCTFKRGSDWSWGRGRVKKSSMLAVAGHDSSPSQ